MGDRSAMGRRGERGLALIELIVITAVLVIFASVLVPEMPLRVDAARESATREELQELVEAICGNPELGRQGYLADMGRLPPGNGLAELISQGSQGSHSIGVGGVGMVWGGPYVIGGLHGDDWLRDGWDRPYRFSSITGQITSPGRDGAFGTGDDLKLPDGPIPAQGQLSVTVRATMP